MNKCMIEIKKECVNNQCCEIKKAGVNKIVYEINGEHVNNQSCEIKKKSVGNQGVEIK